MINISQLFQKFIKMRAADSETKEYISAVIKNIAGVQIENKDISLQDGTLRLTCSPALRQQIFMHKQKILSALTQVKDIR